MSKAAAKIRESFLKRMEELSLSFYDLALIMNRCESQIIKWLSENYNFNINILCKISHALNLTFKIDLVKN